MQERVDLSKYVDGWMRIKWPTARSLRDGARTLVLGHSLPVQHSEAIEPRFAAHYETHIRPQEERFEADRKAAIHTARKRMPWMVLAALPLLGYIFYPSILGGATISENVVTMLFLLMGGVWIWGTNSLYRYRAAIKSEIFSSVVQYFGQAWQYVPEGMQQDEMRSYMRHGLLPQHDSSSTEDFVAGQHKEVSLKQFECRLVRGKGKHRKECFRGMVVEVQVPKRFSGHTVVQRDRGKLGNALGHGSKKQGLERVTLEDPRFEARFEVYGSDQVEARYLLSPSFMERLVALEDFFVQHYDKKCRLRCAFKTGVLQIVAATKYDRFQPGNIYRPVDFRHDINRVLREMDQLFAIIDVLQLDDRTGL